MGSEMRMRGTAAASNHIRFKITDVLRGMFPLSSMLARVSKEIKINKRKIITKLEK